MDLDGRGYSEFYRNTSEELFIKTVMESTVGMPAPSMEMLGFKNLAQNFRTDSEELFKSWLTTGENNGCHPAGIAHRSRQPSRRISTEIANLSNQSTAAIQKKVNDDVVSVETIPVPADSAVDLNTSRAGVGKGMQASNLFLAKVRDTWSEKTNQLHIFVLSSTFFTHAQAWFHSSQPMTRSRSSELRRRYAAMQLSQTPTIGSEVTNEASATAVNNFKHETKEKNGFSNVSPIYENPNQLTTFMSPSNSSSSAFNNPQAGCVDKISSVVNMLKGTLERKKLHNMAEKEESSFEYYSAEEALGHTGLNQAQEIRAYKSPGTFQNVPMLGVAETGVLQKIEESLMEDIMSPTNPTPMWMVSREPSQSESSVAPPIILNGFVDMCDEPCISAQAPTVCESSRNQRGIGRNQDFKEHTYDNSKDIQKKQKGGLIRYGSVTSAGSVDRGDPTKKRRVERSRKMAEAKERSSTPAVPTDMQSILKRCENLEKEVRSLKLNLSFMNRKDSEQTKQIEELQKQNQELSDEKERLLEEIERIIADTGNM
ncbi:protein CYCLOPS-like isoform X2 [Andrographis paniculata]|uniref:protein CYCLOPS-like isoform X2 n=1 Tax=Andrographis paniculata TaxID=175694 RepID=UPI0021E8A098|nr:protein CYCLOPS-like isoform X2 [Andrographis paniculata]